jgi:hypothetical protein
VSALYDRTGRGYPLGELERALGAIAVHPLPIPHDCADGFLGAYWRRPAAYLDGVRGAMSTFARIGDAGPGVARLRTDPESGSWTRRHGDLLERTGLDLGYRLVVAAGRRGPFHRRKA